MIVYSLLILVLYLFTLTVAGSHMIVTMFIPERRDGGDRQTKVENHDRDNRANGK